MAGHRGHCRHGRPWPWALLLAAFVSGGTASGSGFEFGRPVVHAAGASELERLAAREVRRYLYLRTGRLLPVESATATGAGATRAAVVVGRQDRPLVQSLLAAGGLPALGEQEFWLRTVKPKRERIWVLAGGSDPATLHAAYRFAEHLGVRFHLHGDVVPDAPLTTVPMLNERPSPVFALRGLVPFHDFPEGPDWWNRDDYQAVLGQMAKLRLNFLGLHTYLDAAPHAEPTVWIGPESEFTTGGRVVASYPASYNNTLRHEAIGMNWGYSAKPTGAYTHGAALLFDRDGFGADCLLGHLPVPREPADCDAVFNATGEMLREACGLARRLGVRTCVGTEVPLRLPGALQARLRAAGRDPADPAVIQSIYEGMFRRIAALHPLDYYWFWTPEQWTWSGVPEAEVARVVADLKLAVAAHAAVRPPFQLATCGWVLGPAQDRTRFDRALPPEVASSALNREMGWARVDRAFAALRSRNTWAVPWLEDDPGLTAPQLWAGRLRRDAADAAAYGCDGLFGLHWRTRSLAPNLAALAQAGWSLDGWAPPDGAPKAGGPDGGESAAFDAPVADTEDDPLYQTLRVNLLAYRLPLANGAYRVTLKFCEPRYPEAGRRLFDVRLQDQPVLEGLDIAGRVGPNRALDLTFENVAVTQGWLEIAFDPLLDYPCIAALDIAGPEGRLRINCGGSAYADYVADPPVLEVRSRDAPAGDLYQDWTRHEFGPEVAEAAAAIFTALDGRMPRPCQWTDGPGGLRPDPRPWDEVRPAYAFVERFAALHSRVTGTGAQARFGYWLATFRYLEAMARVRCTWGRYEAALDPLVDLVDPGEVRARARAGLLPVRRELVADVAAVYTNLLATVSTPGELGTVANWESHILPLLLGWPGRQLEQILGEELPAEARPSLAYHGPTRVIVPTVRTSYEPAEVLSLRVLVLSEKPPPEIHLRWRPLGRGAFLPVPLQLVARGVYTVTFPTEATAGPDFEYYLEVDAGGGGPVRFPVTAPGLNQTMVRR